MFPFKLNSYKTIIYIQTIYIIKNYFFALMEFIKTEYGEYNSNLKIH